jgi:membrane protease YdiL (CAAX protease family)
MTAAAAALVREVWLRRGQKHNALFVLIQERFPRGATPAWTLVLAFFAGLAATFIPLLIGVFDGRVQATLNGPFTVAEEARGALNMLVVFAWAGAEELTYRGAVMTALSRVASRNVALICTAVLFALEHVGSYQPNAILSAVWVMDGLCFGIAYLLTGNLWMPTVWHTAHNLGIWSMGFFVIQLTPGWFHVEFGGAELGLTRAYGITSAAITLVAVGVYVHVNRKAARPPAGVVG